jgi:protein O-mannosyl-transferase
LQLFQDVRHELFRSPAKSTLILCLLLVAATIALYAPAVQNDFVNFDDDTYILANAHVRAGPTWETVKWSFTTFEQGNWHPLTWLSHALDCQLFGLDPSGHHLINIGLHAASVVILFLLLQSATGFTWRSLMVAALVGLHPVNVESVAWAAERKNVLSMFFFLLALLAYGWYARHPGIRRYGLVCGLYLLALLSKAQVITFPFLLLLWDYWPLGRVAGVYVLRSADGSESRRQYPPLQLFLEKVPLFVLSAADAIVTVVAQSAGHALRTSADYSLLNRTQNALIALLRYLRIAVWPSRLAVFYPHPTELFATWEVVATATLLLLLTVFLARQSRQRPYFVVGWMWFLVAMLPMIGLIQVGEQAMADRYAYIPFLGLFLITVWAVADWAREQRVPTAWMTTAAVGILIALAVPTHRQIGYWRDSSTLWLRALAVNDSFVAHDNLGLFLAQRGRGEEAVGHFRAALAIRPDDPLAMLNLGIYEDQHGYVASAIERYKAVIARVPDSDLRADAYANLGSAYRQTGDYRDAKLDYEEALRLRPEFPMAIVGLGLTAEHDGNPAEAVRQFSTAMAMQPTDVGYLLLASALEQAGHLAEAQAARQRASRISPNLDAAQKQAAGLMETN